MKTHHSTPPTLRRFALLAALVSGFAAAVCAGDTNAPAATMPLAALTDCLVHEEGRTRCNPELALALGLVDHVEPGRNIMLPEKEAVVQGKLLRWIAATRLAGRTQLIIAHAEAEKDGLTLYIYLTSESGKLERALKRVNSGKFTLRALEDSRAPFAEQVAYWQTRLVK